jgi:hypothetical protein
MTIACLAAALILREPVRMLSLAGLPIGPVAVAGRPGG